MSFFPLNLNTSEVFLAIGGLLYDRDLRLFGFDIHCGFWFFSFLNIQIFLPDRKTGFFGQFMVFPQLPRRQPSVPGCQGLFKIKQ